MYVQLPSGVTGLMFWSDFILDPFRGSQWFSGRVLDSRSWGCGFEPNRRHCVVSSGDNLNIQIVTNRIKPNKPFGRIMIQTVRHSDGIPERVFFKIVNFGKISADDKKHTKKPPKKTTQQNKKTKKKKQKKHGMAHISSATSTAFCSWRTFLKTGFIIYGHGGHQNHLKEYPFPHLLEVSISILTSISRVV